MNIDPMNPPVIDKPPYPRYSLEDIVAKLAAADADVQEEFYAAFGRAWAAAKDADSLMPLREFVVAWWPQAAFWTDPEKARRAIARAEDLRLNGPPSELRAQMDARRAAGETGWLWGFAGPEVVEQYEALPPEAQAAMRETMDGVVKDLEKERRSPG